MYAWHFVNKNWHFSHDLADKKIEIGSTLKVDRDLIKLPSHGLYAWPKVLQALHYARTGNLCLVKLGGKIIKDDNLVVAEERTVLAMANIDRTLHEFAIWCAEEASQIEIPEPKLLVALEVKRKWLDNLATDQELSTAQQEAEMLANDTDSAAAWAAVWAAEQSAIRAAAWAADSAANSMAASVATSTMLWVKTEHIGMYDWPAAKAAAKDTQNDKLTQMILKLSEFSSFKNMV